MNRYIALLRGINVGGHKKILMKDLRSLLESIGLSTVTTYIQSGNIVFDSNKKVGLDALISEAIKNKYGWEVPVLVLTASQIATILSNCPFSEEKMEKSYFTIFKEEPSEANIAAANGIQYPGEEFYVTKECLYFYSETGYSRVKMSGNFVESKLKVNATSRNYRTMAKLLDMASV